MFVVAVFTQLRKKLEEEVVEAQDRISSAAQGSGSRSSSSSSSLVQIGEETEHFTAEGHEKENEREEEEEEQARGEVVFLQSLLRRVEAIIDEFTQVSRCSDSPGKKRQEEEEPPRCFLFMRKNRRRQVFFGRSPYFVLDVLSCM